MEMTVMKFSRHDPSYDDYLRWQGICPEGWWRVIQPSQLTGLIHSELLDKTNSVLVVNSGKNDVSMIFAVLNRVDHKASAVDQEPYIAAFDHGATAASGGYVHHGNWSGRTDELGALFFETISASGITANYPLSQMPSGASGLLLNLQISSQNAAFRNSLSALGNS